MSEVLEMVLLDNDPQNAMALQQGLANMGHMVAYATNADMAIQQAERRRPGLAIVQLGAPQAVETAEALQDKFHTAIIFSVDENQDATLPSLGHVNPAGFLARPMRNWELNAVIPAAATIAGDRARHRDRERMLAGIVDGLLDSVIIVNKQGEIKFANLTSSRLLKKPPSEIQSLTFSALFAPDGEGNGELKATMDAIFADSGGGIGSGGRGLVTDGQGGRHSVVVIANPVRDDSSKVDAVSLSFRAAPPQAKQQSADAQMAIQDLGGREEQLLKPPDPEGEGKGDPLRDQAIRAVRARLESGKKNYVVVLVLSQFDMFRMRYGLTSAEKLLHALSAQVLKTLPPEDRLYQWSSRSLVALCERASSLDEVRLEMTSMCSRRVDYFLNASERSALVTLSANWTLLPLFDGVTIDKVTDQVDGFERMHSRVAN